MTDEQRRAFPTNAWLHDLREHAEQAHGATAADYRRNVRTWHHRNHPDCTDEPRYPRAEG